jgi:hypothetical protein
MPEQSSATGAAPRAALQKLAAEPDTLTVRKLWKALTVAERTDALRAAFAADEQGAIALRAAQALIKAKRYRPQTVAAMNAAKLATELAPVPIDDTALIDAALIDLHFAHRRPMMGAFLDAAGIPHEDARLPEDTSTLSPSPESLRAAADTLAASYPLDDVYVYFLTLALQDENTWGALKGWLRERPAA